MKKASQKLLEGIVANPRFGKMPGSRQLEVGAALDKARLEAEGRIETAGGEVMDVKSLPQREREILQKDGIDTWHRRFCVQVGPDKVWVRKEDHKKWLASASDEEKTYVLEGEDAWHEKYFQKVGPKNEWAHKEWYDALPDAKKKEIGEIGVSDFQKKYYEDIKGTLVGKEWYQSLPSSEQSSIKQLGVEKWQEGNVQKYLKDLPSTEALTSWLDKDILSVSEDDLQAGSEGIISVHFRDTWAKEYFSKPYIPSPEFSAGFNPIAPANTVHYVKLGTGEFVPLTFFASLPDEYRGLLYKTGLDPVQALDNARGKIMSNCAKVQLRPEDFGFTVEQLGWSSHDFSVVRGLNDRIPKADAYLEEQVKAYMLPLIQRAYPNLSEGELQSMMKEETSYLHDMAKNLHGQDTAVAAKMAGNEYNKKLKEDFSKNSLSYADIVKLIPSRVGVDELRGTTADKMVYLLSKFEQQLTDKDRDISKLGETVQQIREISKSLGEEGEIDEYKLKAKLGGVGITDTVYSPWFVRSEQPMIEEVTGTRRGGSSEFDRQMGKAQVMLLGRRRNDGRETASRFRL